MISTSDEEISGGLPLPLIWSNLYIYGPKGYCNLEVGLDVGWPQARNVSTLDVQSLREADCYDISRGVIEPNIVKVLLVYFGVQIRAYCPIL